MAADGTWQKDPNDPERLRWRTHDGEWTDYVATADKTVSTDPVLVPTKHKRRKWPWIVLACFVAIGVVGAISENTEEPPSSTQAPTPAPTTLVILAATTLVEKCFDPWDGNHNGFEALIRDVLNDPSSMETHGTYFNASDSLSDGTITIRLDYSSGNIFGGMERTSAWAEMDTDCEIAIVTDYG